jgi:hypothetical protein
MVLTHAIQAADCTTGGGKIVLFRGTARQEVDFSSRNQLPAPMPSPASAEQQLTDTALPGNIHGDEFPETSCLPDNPPQIWGHGGFWRNVLRIVENTTDGGMLPGPAAPDDPPREPTFAVTESEAHPTPPATVLVQPAAASDVAIADDSSGSFIPVTPAAQKVAASEFSALEIISLSVGISFGLSLLAIWLVAMVVRQFLGPSGAVLDRDAPGLDASHGSPVSARQSDGQSIPPHHLASAERRNTQVIDLAHNPLTLARVADNCQPKHGEEHARRKDQQTAILERIYQDNVALQQIS